MPEVDHRPLELVRGRHSDDLVIDIVQIAVCLHLHTAQNSVLEGLRVDHAEVVLRGVLGAEVLIPDEGIVQVVEGRHAEDPFVEATQAEVVLTQGLVAGDEGGCPLALLGGLAVLGLRPVVDVGVKEAGLCLQFAVAVVGSRCGEECEAGGVGEGVEVGREAIVLHIGGQCHAPVVTEAELMGGGEIALLLVVMVVDVHRRHIQPWVGEVVEVVVGVLRIRQQGVPTEGLAQCALRHHVGIPLTVLMLELPRLFAHEGSRVATLRAIEISLGAPLTFVKSSEEPRLEAQGVHIAIVANGCRVVAVLLLVGEAVAPRGIEVFATHREVEGGGEALLVEEGGIDSGEGACLESSLEVGPTLGGEGGAARRHVERGCRGEALRRLEDGATLTIIYGDGLHIVEGEAPEVYLPILRIAQLQAIIEDAHMLGAHAAYVHRLQPPDAAVVLDLDTREVAQGVSYAHGTKALEVAPAQDLCGYDILRDQALRDDHALEDVDTVNMPSSPSLGQRKEQEAQ